MQSVMIESLESRRLLSATMGLSNGVLYVAGTSGPDTLTASENGGLVTLDLNGHSQTFDTHLFSQLNIHMGGGNDTVLLGSIVDRPAQIWMGGGDDYARGTGMADVIHGGAGNDTLYGAGGDDMMYAGTGNNMLYGNTGNDTLHGMTGSDQMNGGPGQNSMMWKTGMNGGMLLR